MSPAAWRCNAAAGAIHWWSSISPPSTATSWFAARAAKNQVAKRFGVSGGGVQWANHTKSSGAAAMPASSRVSRAAALRAAVSGVAPSAPSSASMRPPGNTHIPPKAMREFLRSINTSGVAASRSSTTVAAGVAGGPSAAFGRVAPPYMSLRWRGGSLVAVMAHPLLLGARKHIVPIALAANGGGNPVDPAAFEPPWRSRGVWHPR